MPRRPEIPDSLIAGPFHRRAALDAGLSPDQLRSSCWQRLFREVYCLAGTALSPELRLRALLLAAPDHVVVTGLTAAWLYGVWNPVPGQPVPLETATRHSEGAFQNAGRRSGRLRLDTADITELHGVRITSPDWTSFSLMRRSSLVEAVVVADAFLHAELITQDGHLNYADAHRRWPHVAKVRTAIGLASPHAESPMESRLRMVIVLAGLPVPHVNSPIHDTLGRFLGRPDLHYVDPWVGIEYDGRYHDGAEQRERDDERENRLLVARVPLLRYGPRAVYQTPHRIVSDILGLRPDLRPVRSSELSVRST